MAVPPYIITGSDYTKSWSVTCVLPATIENVLLAVCLGFAAKMNAVVPLDNIAVDALPAPAVASYSYVIKAKDGRVWNQTIVMDQVTDPQNGWSGTDKWRLSEVALQLPILTAITQLIQSIQPTSMKVTFA